MHLPDPAYRIYMRNSPLRIQEHIKELNHLISHPNITAEIIIHATNKLKTLEEQLRTVRTKHPDTPQKALLNSTSKFNALTKQIYDTPTTRKGII